MLRRSTEWTLYDDLPVVSFSSPLCPPLPGTDRARRSSTLLALIHGHHLASYLSSAIVSHLFPLSSMSSMHLSLTCPSSRDDHAHSVPYSLRPHTLLLVLQPARRPILPPRTIPLIPLALEFCVSVTYQCLSTLRSIGFVFAVLASPCLFLGVDHSILSIHFVRTRNTFTAR